MDSNVGLAIQCVGILLLTLLSLFMRASVQSPALRYWTAAWGGLSVALLSLFLGFHVVDGHKVFYFVYFLGEYLFCLMLIAGCRNYMSDWRLRTSHCYWLLAAIAVATVLPWLSEDFNDLFMVQALILASAFASSFFILRVRPSGPEPTPGRRVMCTALLLLAFDFAHYVPLFAARKGFWGITIPIGYLQYTSIFDLILEILLGFGIMMVLMESVRSEVELVNHRLLHARDKLQLLAQMDPLTEALNRHAFHSLLSRPESGEEARTSGSVAIIDIDNLKPINDTMGHTAGDKAIRSVARAMRSLIRADDMLFRWGGDEFLVLMFKLPEADAARRMSQLNDILKANCETWTGTPLKVTVSHGVAGFDSLTELGTAIEAADLEMYRRRNEIRGVSRSRQDQVLV